jgi:hypothetical protein
MLEHLAPRKGKNMNDTPNTQFPETSLDADGISALMAQLHEGTITFPSEGEAVQSPVAIAENIADHAVTVH